MDIHHYLDDNELESLMAECERAPEQLPQTVKSAVLASVHREELRVDNSFQQAKTRWMDSIIAHNLRVASAMVACIALLFFLPSGFMDSLWTESVCFGNTTEWQLDKSGLDGIFGPGSLYSMESNVIFRQERNQIFVREDVTK